MKMYSPTPRYFSLETISGFSPALITGAVTTLLPCRVGYAVPLNPEQLLYKSEAQHFLIVAMASRYTLECSDGSELVIV